MAKQQLKPAGGLGRFNALAMGLALLGILLCAGLLYLQVVQGGNSNHNAHIADTHADALAAMIDSRYRELRKQLTLLARTNSVISALSSNDSAAQSAEEARLLASIAHARRVELIGLGTAKVDLNAATPINFVALDLLRRAELTDFVGPEASANPGDVLYAAAQVTDSSEVLGVLFVALSDDYINDSLAGFNSDLGLLQIEQSVDNAGPAIVIEYGSGTQALVTLRRPLQAPGWVALFSGNATTKAIDFNSLWLPLAAALALGLGGIWLAFSRLTKVIDDDCDALVDYGANAFGGHAGKTDHFQIDALQNVAKNFAGTIAERTANISAVKSARTAKSTNPEPTLDSPPAKQDQERADKQAAGAKKAAAVAGTLAAGSVAADQLSNDADDFLDIDEQDQKLTSAAPTAGTEPQSVEEANDLTADFKDLTDVSDDNFGMEVSEVDDALPDMEFDAGIFRAYDIRGIVDTNLTPKVVYWIGRAFAAQAKSEGQTRTAVGRDGRLSSPELAQQLIHGLLEGGMDVVDIGQVTTPMLYFATHTLNTGTGVMITGSHNPPEYNGLKMMIGGSTLAEGSITALHQRLLDNKLDYESTEGELAAVVIDSEYIDRILDDVAVAKSLKVVVDCGNGVAGGVAPLLLQELGCEVIPLYCEVDGTFPNHHPDPAEPVNLTDLIKMVKTEQADIGLAFDGDGDRIGVVTNSGQIIWPDKLMMLFARDIVGRNPGSDIIFDVKCSRHLNNLIAEHGGRPVMWKTGHSHMKAKLKETGALLAGEFSGHLAFGERWYGFDDAVYSAARLLEILGGGSASMSELFAEFPETQSTPELKIQTTEDAKFKIMDRLAANGDFKEGTVTSIDGIRVDYENSWGLIRASNTSPVLTLRFEADTEADLDAVQNIFRTELAKIHSALTF